MLTKALIILASISAALATPYIIQPVSSTTFQAGQSASVRWEEGTGTVRPTLEDFDLSSLAIYVGNPLQQTRLQVLSPSVNVSKEREFTFTPDATIGPNSSEYFIRMESLSFRVNVTTATGNTTAPAQAFSAKFRLSGMTGTFSDAVSRQINSQSTTSGPPSTSTVSKPSSSPTLTTSATSRVASPASRPTSTPGSAADSIVFHGNWIAFLLAFFGVTML